jgi:hypothetical protein
MGYPDDLALKCYGLAYELGDASESPFEVPPEGNKAPSIYHQGVGGKSWCKGVWCAWGLQDMTPGVHPAAKVNFTHQLI